MSAVQSKFMMKPPEAARGCSSTLPEGKLARTDDSTRRSVQAGSPERWQGNVAENLIWRSKLQGAQRHAKSLIGAADAEYRDCSCGGEQREAEWLPCKYKSVLVPHAVLPNPSLEARPNIKTPGPRSGASYYPHRRPGVLLSVPPQLER